MSAAVGEEVIDDLLEQTPPDEGQGGGAPAGEEETPPEPTAMERAVEELTKTQKTILERVNAPKEIEPVKRTPEQEAEFWAVFDPEATDKEFMRKFFRMNPEATDDEVKQARDIFAMVQKGLVKQSVMGSKRYVDHIVEQVRAEYAPALKYMEEARAEATRTKFFGDYPALKEKKYEKIIAASAQSLANAEFADEPSYFKALAELAAGTIKGIIPEFDLGKQPEPAGKAPKLNRTRVGGGGGAGKGKSSTEDSTDDSDSVFGEDD